MEEDYKPLMWAIFIALFAKLVVISLVSQEKIIQFMADDSFIYLELVKNSIENNIISFDGKNWTNGFHPLYFLIMYPLFKIFGGILAYPTISLIVLSLFDVLTSVWIYKTVRLYYGRKTSLLSASFWLFNPGTWLIMMTGVEAAFVGFFFSMFIYFYISGKKQGKTSYSFFLKIALLYAVLFLTRTEFVLLSIPLALDFILYLKRRSFLFWKQVIPRGLIMSVAVIALISPWLIYGHVYADSLTQESGKAIFTLTHIDFNSNPSLFNFFYKSSIFGVKYTLKLINNLGSSFLFGLALAVLLKGQNGVTLLSKKARYIFVVLLIISGFASSLIPEPILGLSEEIKSLALIVFLGGLSFIFSYLLIDYERKDSFKSIFKESWFLVFFAGLHFLFYSLYHWLIQMWYIYSVILVSTLFLAPPIFSYLLKRKNNILIGGIFLFLFVKLIVLYFNPLFPWQVNSYEGAIWLRDNTAQESLIGATDAGIVAFYSDREIINLDGLVNKEATQAIKNNSLNEYISRKEIKYLFGNKINHPDFEVIHIIDKEVDFPERIWKKV